MFAGDGKGRIGGMETGKGGSLPAGLPLAVPNPLSDTLPMLNDPTKEAVPESVEARCYFVRGRNALAVRADLAAVYTDYYLHLMQHRIRYPEEQDRILKEWLAAAVLHLAARPHSEATAWTIHWSDPLLNLFVTGSNRQGNVTGRIFTDNVSEKARDLFHVQSSADGGDLRHSTVELERLEAFSAVENFYRRSEQRPARFFRHGEEDFVFVVAQPDCDLAWLDSLDDGAIRELDSTEQLGLLETRHYRFECGCGPEKIFPIVAGLSEGTLEEVFAGEEVIAANCPRCGARYALTKELLEAFQSERE